MTQKAPQKTNMLAIVSLIMAFFIPLVGLVLAIIALNQIKKRHEGGKGLAIAGTILSAVFLVAEIIAVIALSVLFYFSFQRTVQSNEAQDNVTALHMQLEAFHEDNQYYPSLVQLNDPAWREINMPDLNPEVFSGEHTSATLASKPSQDTIAYRPATVSGEPCDNIMAACTQYTLLVNLTRDRTFEKQSLGTSTQLW